MFWFPVLSLEESGCLINTFSVLTSFYPNVGCAAAAVAGAGVSQGSATIAGGSAASFDGGCAASSWAARQLPARAATCSRLILSCPAQQRTAQRHQRPRQGASQRPRAYRGRRTIRSPECGRARPTPSCALQSQAAPEWPRPSRHHAACRCTICCKVWSQMSHSPLVML